jgi:hypothetical protein
MCFGQEKAMKARQILLRLARGVQSARDPDLAHN